MIQPILKTPPTTLLGTQSGAFELLGKHLKSNNVMSGIELAEHVESCMANLHALTHRNKSMGDQAMDNIVMIVKHGKFLFEGHSLSVECPKNILFNQVDLGDLRSHSLLLGLKQKDEIGIDSYKNIAKRFLELINAAETIRTSVNELFKLGYFSIYAYSQTTKKLRQLQTMEKKLQHYVEVSQMV